MLDGLRLYGRYIDISFRSQMQYRASFVMLSVGHGLMTGLEFLGIWVLFDRFAALDTWSLPEVAFFLRPDQYRLCLVRRLLARL